MLAEQPFLIGGATWIEVRDGNPTALSLFDRHYTSKRRERRKIDQFVGPGEKVVLLTPCARALFVWRKYVSDDRQRGVNCAVFRNEGAGLSSALIRAAMDVAWLRWPGERLFTYVNPKKLRSTNPGFCFLAAGWKRCGVTKWNRLLILEAAPETSS
jgi:hypothetical protein